VDVAVEDPAVRGAVIEIGGPENLTMNELVERFRTITGALGKDSHVPLAVMR